MLKNKPNTKLIEEWKAIYRENRPNLKPNRVTGKELNDYFLKKYLPEALTDEKYIKIAEYNLLNNDFNSEKLQGNLKPQIKAYLTEDIIVCIDQQTGFFHIEGDNIKKTEKIYDDLFFHRGLDEYDLENFFLVAQYINLKNK